MTPLCDSLGPELNIEPQLSASVVRENVGTLLLEGGSESQRSLTS